MAELILNEDKSEILRYAGYHKGLEISEGIDERIVSSIETTNRVAKIRSYWRKFDIEDSKEGIVLKQTGVILKGESIRKHLAGCKSAVLFCTTIGGDFDREVSKVMLTDAASGIILNSCGVTLVEKACDEVQEEIDRVLESGKTGQRFSPGYGDLPLETQKDFLRLLNMEKTVGIRLSTSCWMKPEKSVTAIAGIIE